MVLYSTSENPFPNQQKTCFPNEEADDLCLTRHLKQISYCQLVHAFPLTNTGAALSANERALGPGKKFTESILSHSPSGERLSTEHLHFSFALVF